MTKKLNFEEIMNIEEMLERKKANNEIKNKKNNFKEYTLYSYLFLKLWIIIIVFLIIELYFDLLSSPLFLIILLALLSSIFFIISMILSIYSLRYKNATDKNYLILIVSIIFLIIVSFYTYVGWSIHNWGLNYL